jgi:hypothetical protein
VSSRADASPLIAGNVEVGAQRPPDVAGVDAVLDCLRAGAPVQAGQHMVDEHRGPADRAELSLDELMEFRQPHTFTLPGPGQRLLAHAYRIGEVGDARSRPSCSVAVARRRQHLTDRIYQRL